MILAAARGQRGPGPRPSGSRPGSRRLAGSQAAEIKKELAKVQKEYGKHVKDYTDSLKKLLPFQRADFAGLFKEMHGTPVTIRTLDPPLHEFLPKREELMVKVATLTAKGGAKNKKAIAEAEKLLRAVEELHEFNPMLGHRGCRLGITYPEITRMQARAIFEAALSVAKKGEAVKPEVMIPLVGHVEELRRQKKIVLEEAERILGKDGSGVDYLVGTMIEVPRGALTADEIAKEADFFSFGTNDLTQMGFGLSRDDAAKFLLYYQEHGLLEKDPFVSLDAEGVGQLVEIGVKKGRAARPGLKIGDLRRARRRPLVHPLLPQRGPRLRVLLALSGAHRPPGRGPGAARAVRERLDALPVNRVQSGFPRTSSTRSRRGRSWNARPRW